MVKVDGPVAPVIETNRTGISCGMESGYPNWLDDVVWYRNDIMINIGQGKSS